MCGLRRPFRLQRNRAGRSHAMRVLLRAQNSLRSFRGPARKPGTFRSAKKHKFQRQQLANLCFFNASLRWPRNPSLRPKSRACARLASARACGRRTANEVAFSVARETARMTFARSHAARVPENGIWNRAANRAPAVAGEIISAQRPFRTHAVRNAGLCAGLKPHRARRDSQYHFSTHP